MTRKLLLLAIVAVFTIGAQYAFANPGLVIFDGWVEESNVPIEDSLGGVDENPCDFPVYVDALYHETDKAFFDEDGNLVELRFWVRQATYWYYTDPPVSEVVLEEKNTSYFASLDLVTGSLMVRGNGFHLTVPKIGNLVRHTGIWEFDFFTEEFIDGNGNQDVYPDGDWSAFCDALAGD
jgi:hypothetical protein